MLFRNNYLHYFLLVFLSLLFAYEYNHFIQTDELMMQSLSGKYTEEIIGKILNMRHTWQWLGYVFVPVLLYITTTLIALAIFLVIWLYYLDDVNFKVRFSDTWRIVLFAQWSSIAAVFVRIVWFGVFHTHYSLEELQSFFPLSLIDFYDVKKNGSIVNRVI